MAKRYIGSKRPSLSGLLALIILGLVIGAGAGVAFWDARQQGGGALFWIVGACILVLGGILGCFIARLDDVS